MKHFATSSKSSGESGDNQILIKSFKKLDNLLRFNESNLSPQKAADSN
jgi:hypothetical protein